MPVMATSRAISTAFIAGLVKAQPDDQAHAGADANEDAHDHHADGDVSPLELVTDFEVHDAVEKACTHPAKNDQHQTADGGIEKILCYRIHLDAPHSSLRFTIAPLNELVCRPYSRFLDRCFG